jgi:WD40 repeat protein
MADCVRTCDGCVLTAACSQHAVVRVWTTRDWRQVAQLGGHALTVVQMEFSHSDRLLLTASRDRLVGVFRRRGDAFDAPIMLKAHQRIVWRYLTLFVSPNARNLLLTLSARCAAVRGFPATRCSQQARATSPCAYGA